MRDSFLLVFGLLKDKTISEGEYTELWKSEQVWN